MPKFVSDILAKAGLTVDGVVTLNNTATGQTPSTNDNSTKLATTAWVRTYVAGAASTYTLPIASASVLGGIKVGSGLSIDGTGILSATGASLADIRRVETITATAGQTTVTVPGGYIASNTSVFVNGVFLNASEYTANGTTLVFADALSAGDVVSAVIISPFYTGQLPDTRQEYVYTATAGQTTFAADYIVGQLDIYYNGSKLTAANYTAANGTSVTLGFAAAAGDIIEIQAWYNGLGISASSFSATAPILYNSSTKVFSLATSGATAGSYGSSSAIPTITVDAYGRITSISTTAVQIVSSLSGLSDVSLTSAADGDLLKYNGTAWVNYTPDYVRTTTNQSIAGEKTFTNVTTFTENGGTRWMNNAKTSTWGSITGNTYFWQFSSGADTILFNSKNDVNAISIAANGNTTMTNVTATSFVKSGGSSSEFLKADGSVDSTSYASISYVSSTYLPLSGGTVVGNVNFGPNPATGNGIIQIVRQNTSAAGEIVFLTASSGNWSIGNYGAGASNTLGFYNNTGTAMLSFVQNGAATFSSSVTASSFVKSGGTSSQFLKADGSVDSSTYATQTYVGTQISNLINGAPTALDTLNELAAALGNDASFASTVTNSLATKVAATRTLTINSTTYDLSADRTWTIDVGVTSFNTRTGAVTLTSSDVTTALTYTPANDTTVVHLAGAETITGIKVFNANTGFGSAASSPKAELQMGARTTFFTTSSINSNLGNNVYYDGTNFRRIAADNDAPLIQLHSDGYIAGFFQSDALTAADSIITYSEKFRFSKNGSFFLGTTTDAGYLMDVNGTVRFSSAATITGNLYMGVTTSSYRVTVQSSNNDVTSSSIYLNNTNAGTAAASYLTLGASGASSWIGNYSSVHSNPAWAGRMVIGMSSSGNGITLSASGGASQDIRFAVQLGEAMRVTSTQNVLIGTVTDVTTSILTLNSSTKGFLPPRMTLAQRLAITSPATGLVVYQTDGTEGLYIKLASGWKALAIV